MGSEPSSALESVHKINPSADAIGSFIADWVQIKYFYSEAASLAQELCETLLASNAIRAIVTHRVKPGHRLEAKLRERVRKLGREYRSAKEIRDDVVDLAGVRIALYFPSDREKVDKIVHDAFTDVKHKSFPEEGDKRISDTLSGVTETPPDFQQRFHGYSADHYQVRMKVGNLATKRIRDDFQKTNPVIEIQVASVLMHAWAEIDHDLVYKTLTGGPASQQELRLLDATNGLVHTGEVLLQQLQTAMDDRVAYQTRKFSEQYELLSFLRGQIKRAKGSMEHLDILLLVLKITDLDSPQRLGEILEGFVIPPKSTAPIALSILEHIFGSVEEQQRRINNLYLRPRSVRVTDLKADRTNSKYYIADLETRDKILDQRDILEMAVSVADIMRFPEKSILVVEGMPQNFRKFYSLYNLVHFATIRSDKQSRGSEKWLCDISLKELDPLWTWFETNEDVLFRVSLLLARLNVEEIDQELIKLRPSSGSQRLPSMHDPSPEYMSPGYMSPTFPTTSDYHSPEVFGRGDSRHVFDTEPKPSRSQEESAKSQSGPGTMVLQKKQQNQKRISSPLDPYTSEEDEEEILPVAIPVRARRAYVEEAPDPDLQKTTIYTDYSSRPTPPRLERVPKKMSRRSRGSTSEREAPGEQEYYLNVRTKSPVPEEKAEYVDDYVQNGSLGDSESEEERRVTQNYQDQLNPRTRPRSPPPLTRAKLAEIGRGARYQPVSPPAEPMHRVPEAPEPPEGFDIRPDDAQMHTNVSMPEETKRRRKKAGKSQRNDHHRSQDPGLRARFEQPPPRGGSWGGSTHNHPPPMFHNEPPKGYPPAQNYPQPPRRPYNQPHRVPAYQPQPMFLTPQPTPGSWPAS